MTRPPDDRDREALIAALATDAEEARSGAAAEPPPEPEKLLDYLAGRLDPKEEERLSRYLMANPEASRALLDLADLEAAGNEAGKRPAELAAVAGWRDLERRLPSAPSRFHGLRTLLPSIAAALLVATLGLSAWIWRLQGELNQPVANLRSQTLAVTRAGSASVLALAPGAPLRLVFRPAVRCPVYTAEITGIEGPVRRETVEGLELDSLGNLSLLLPRVEPGTYTLRLSGCEPQREIENYRFRITPDGG